MTTQTTRRTALRTTLGLATIALFALTGCGGGDGTVNPDSITLGTPRRSGDLEFNLTATKSKFALGEIIPLTFIIKNLSASEMAITTSGPGAGKYEVSLNGRVVNFGPAGAARVFNFTLPAGEQRMVPLECSLNEPSDVPGDYQILAFMSVGTSARTTYNANPITVSVR